MKGYGEKGRIYIKGVKGERGDKGRLTEKGWGRKTGGNIGREGRQRRKQRWGDGMLRESPFV